VTSSRFASVGLLFLTLTVSSAFAVPYRFSQAGWPGGGEITGTFDIDLDYPTLNPGNLYVEALTSFDCHWTGNIYSQPYDWSLNQVFNDFLFDIGSQSIVSMRVGDFSDPNSAFYDATLPLIWDFRQTAIDIDPLGDSGRYRCTGPLFVTRVPDENSTALLLGLALVSLFIIRRALLIKPA